MGIVKSFSFKRGMKSGISPKSGIFLALKDSLSTDTSFFKEESRENIGLI